MIFGSSFGTVITPNTAQSIDDLDARHLYHCLLEKKALLFRGFSVNPNTFCQFSECLGEGFMDYQGGAFERKSIDQNPTLLSVTGDGQTFAVPLHGEMYYRRNKPAVLWFYCATAPISGGETTLCDGAEFFSQLSSATQELFFTHKLVYIRTYTAVQWPLIYQTHDLQTVKNICQANGLSVKTRPMEGIETRYEASAVVYDKHDRPMFINNVLPILTQERVWGLENNRVRLNGEDLISETVFQELVKVSNALEIKIPWQVGDIVLIDNHRLMHGRCEITDNNRKILVRMSNLKNFAKACM